MKNDFLKAIENKQLVRITFNSFEKGKIGRKCVPFDYGESRKFKDGKERYHLWDLECPDGDNHNLPLLPSQMINIEVLKETFNPADYVQWTPNWIIPRDWGQYS